MLGRNSARSENDTLKTLFHRFDFVIGILFVLFVAWWIWRHVRNSRAEKTSDVEAV
jgi:hypothetical protein